MSDQPTVALLPALSLPPLEVARARAELAQILRDRSVRTGQFTLASGQVSDLYVDARQTTLHPRGAVLIARLLLDRLAPGVVGIGGPVTGADPITGATIALSELVGSRPLAGFMVRKEAKGHGAGNQIEGRGNLPPGAKVCIVEDTVTTGGSLARSVAAARADGLDVVQCICVVDRREGGAEALEAEGLRLEALFLREELV